MKKVGMGLHDALLTKMAQTPRGRVLDVGAGSGDLAMRLATQGFEAEACDCLPATNWQARDHVAYRQCDLNRSLPYDDDSFDCVICLEVIEHVDDPFALCREFRRVLRKEGRVYISTPNILNMRSWMKFLLDGSFLFFTLPPIEWEQRDGRPSVHVHPIRYHELEFYLYQTGLPSRKPSPTNDRWDGSGRFP